MLDYKLIEAFAAVIEEGGFEKAARRLHLTQSAVSQRIKQLEEHYGQVLLQRTIPPKTTLPGDALLGHYRQVKHLEEDLFSQQAIESPTGFISLALGINADTLATWFLRAVEPFLREERVVLDLHIDDQDKTHKMLQEGKVWGCITTRSKPIQGCRINFLGTMHYGLFSSPGFAETWFTGGFSIEGAMKAPSLRFNRKDGLNEQMFQQVFKKLPVEAPTFFIPSSEMFVEFIRKGLCYGVLPEQQSRMLQAQGEIVNLAPGHSVQVDLYWHCWNLRSVILETFTKRFTKEVAFLLGKEATSISAAER